MTEAAAAKKSPAAIAASELHCIQICVTVRRLSEIDGDARPDRGASGSSMPHSTCRSPRLKAALHQKGSLESFIYEKTVNRA